MSVTLWQCTLYDSLTDYPYSDHYVYRAKEDAEQRAKRMTYVDDGIEHWATVHPLEGCWKRKE